MVNAVDNKAHRAGRYVSQPGGYSAFIPAPLPPDPQIDLDGRLRELLSQADYALGRLSILNRTALTADTNRKVIRDRLPNEYITELIDQNGRPTVEAMMATHLISPTAIDILLRRPFTLDDFESFLAERQRSIQDSIEELLVKERLDLAPPLRQLDAEIESVEIALREVIRAALADSADRLPSHIRDRADERLQSALWKNPALDADHAESLAGKLEYCDFRELEAWSGCATCRSIGR